MTFLIYTVSVKTIQSINVSEWSLLIFSGRKHPVPTIFDGLLYPLEPPIFFFFFFNNQNNRKGCTLDYLDT